MQDQQIDASELAQALTSSGINGHYQRKYMHGIAVYKQII